MAGAGAGAAAAAAADRPPPPSTAVVVAGDTRKEPFISGQHLMELRTDRGAGGGGNRAATREPSHQPAP